MQKCETCEYEKVCEIPDFVRNDLKSCKTYKEKKVKTNADRIRSMSDEELAEWLHNITQFDGDDGELMISIYNLDSEKDEDIRDSYGDLLDWLKKGELNE